MKTDTIFLAESSFAEYFNFSTKSDPFLVIPSTMQNPKRILRKGSPHQPNQKTKVVVPLPNNLIKRLKAW